MTGDETTHERSWRAQRVGWLVMTMLVFLGLVGLLGPGPLSRAKLESSALRLEYRRIERVHAPSAIEIELQDSGSGRDLTLWLDRAFLDRYEVHNVVPRPREEIAGDGGATFRFDGGSAPGLRRIRFDIEPRRCGPLRAHIATFGTAPLAFSQLVLP